MPIRVGFVGAGGNNSGHMQRVSTMPGKFGEKTVIRIIDNRNSIVSLDKLGFSAPMLEAWKGIIQQPNEIVWPIVVLTTRATADALPRPNPSLWHPAQITVRPQQKLSILAHLFSSRG